jgi:hypothetical protein
LPVGSGTLQLNRWYHVAAVQSTGQVEYFVDGASIGTKSNASAYGSSAAKPANIGANNSSVAFMKGSIDEVRVYNRALSAQEVTTLYANGAAGIAQSEEPNSFFGNIFSVFSGLLR